MKLASIASALVLAFSVNATATAEQVFSNVEYCQLSETFAATQTHTLCSYAKRLGYTPSRQECNRLNKVDGHTPQFALESELRELRRTSGLRLPSQTVTSLRAMPAQAQEAAFEQFVGRTAPR
ncbi:MAG: hypothetical protein HLUCCO02_02380 [Idiomarinaceae bacterium HL-53]|nr:MAG: hypothetical protein HLUCCO02_02380 [Idiomarinaceae bacterium HL-53]CUS48867.1 hypothetical protein Ga0003345_1847 [Idiomarinaceae bacterium HL-53]